MPVAAQKRRERFAERRHNGLERLKWETARELGLDDDLQDPDELTVREAGAVGGHMVRKLVKRAEAAMEAGAEPGTGTPGGRPAKGRPERGGTPGCGTAR